MNKLRPSRAFYLLFAGAIIIGVAGIFWQLKVLQKQEASLQWPVVTGTIVQSTRTYVPGRDSHYRADVYFRYDVNDTRHVSHQISLWSSDLSFYGRIADLFVVNHPTGSPVKVYYDPGKPENAVLIPGAYGNENATIIGAAAAVIVLGIVGIINRRRREEPRLIALLNDPTAPTRTISMRKSDIEKGMGAFLTNFLVAGGFGIFAMALLLTGFLSGPASLPGARPTPPWQLITGAICAMFALFSLLRAGRRSRSAQCPLCGNLLNKQTFSKHKCDVCGTRIIFEDENQSSEIKAEKHIDPRHSSGRKPIVITVAFQKGRLIDVVGFMAAPLLLLWLLFGSKNHNAGVAVLLTIILSVLGALYYFCPEDAGNEDEDDDNDTAAVPIKRDSAFNTPNAPDSHEKVGPYLFDSCVILSAPIALILYLLSLVWQHRVLDTRGLTCVAIGFPAAIGVVSFICYLRFTHARKLNIPKPPAFVPLSLLALWVAGTFVSVVFLACLFYRLKPSG